MMILVSNHRNNNAKKIITSIIKGIALAILLIGVIVLCVFAFIL